MYLLTVTAGIDYDRDGKALVNKTSAMTKIRDYLAQSFGGYTERATHGGWHDKYNRLVTENGTQWEIMFDSPADNEAESRAHAIAHFIRKAIGRRTANAKANVVIQCSSPVTKLTG